MEKLLKRVISVVCAIAMVITCMTFTPSTVNAGTALPKDSWTTVGPWQLYNGLDDWCHYAAMEYEKSGNQMGDVKMILKASGFDDGDSEYGLGAKLVGYSEGKGLEADYTYNCDVTYTSTTAGTLIVNIEGVEYRKEIEAGEDVEATVATFDHNILATSSDVIFYPTLLAAGTELTIKSVEFNRPEDDKWIPVKNFDPDDPHAGPATYTHAGKVDLMAMYGSGTSAMYGKMKYQVLGEGTDVSDTRIKINSTSGWTGSWSVTARLTDFCKTAKAEISEGVYEGDGLIPGDEYDCYIDLYSLKATPLDEFDEAKKIRIVVSGTSYDVALEEGTNHIVVPNVKYSSDKPNIDFEFDNVYDKERDKVTKPELAIESVKFKVPDSDWTKVPNETKTRVGAWDLFARFGSSVEEGQWGKLSYQNTVDDPETLDQTKIKVRSSSGYLGAWVTLAMLPDFIDGQDGHQSLEVGTTYKPVIWYTSTKATGKDDSGDNKHVLMSVDDVGSPFTLKESPNTPVKAELPEFIYEHQKYEHDYDITFNLDQVEPGTELNILSVTFEEVTDGWKANRNAKYDQMGQSGMYSYARFDADTNSWGKTSYKYEGSGNPDTDTDFSNYLIKTRTVSGWYVTNNPASVLLFRGLAAQEMSRGNKYKIRVTADIDRSDEVKALDGTPSEIHNNLKILWDEGGSNAKEYVAKKLDDGENIVIETPEFETYYRDGTDPDKDDYTGDNVKLVLDEFTRDATIKVKSVEFIRDDSQPLWNELEQNATTQTVGKWTLYSNFDATTESWGRLLYSVVENPETELAGVKINAFSTSGWIGARSIRAVLSKYTDAEHANLKVGENYAAYITIDSSEDCLGKNADNNDKGIQVTIDDYNYMIPIHKGKYTYVIPRLNENFRKANENVQFDLDMLDPETVITISDVEFKAPVETPVDISAMATQVNNDNTVTVTWEQTKDTVYGVVGNLGGFNILVDNKVVGTVDGTTRTFTTSALSAGPHTITVVATLGDQANAGKESKVDVGGGSTPTTTTTNKTTTKSSDVKVPGKAAVKKIAKRKKSAKKMKVTLKKIAGATKYQVAVYKTKKNAKKNKKALVKKTTTKLKFTIKSKKLKGKKTLFVRARAWNTAGFGAWSGIKKSKAK